VNSVPEAAGTAITDGPARKSPVRYVFYVIKENRNIRPDNLVMSRKGTVTPHWYFGVRKFHTPKPASACKRTLSLLDNFFVDGEVSADGHNWSMGALLPPIYLEENLAEQLRGKGWRL